MTQTPEEVTERWAWGTNRVQREGGRRRGMSEKGQKQKREKQHTCAQSGHWKRDSGVERESGGTDGDGGWYKKEKGVNGMQRMMTDATRFKMWQERRDGEMVEQCIMQQQQLDDDGGTVLRWITDQVCKRQPIRTRV